MKICQFCYQKEQAERMKPRFLYLPLPAVISDNLSDPHLKGGMMPVCLLMPK